MVLPSDHFVADDTIFMEHVVEVLKILESQPDRIILLDAEPTEPETDYGWIEVGAMRPGSGRNPVYRVRRFIEKPGQEIANELFASGALWNTSVFAGRAATLIEMLGLGLSRPARRSSPASCCGAPPPARAA